LEEVIKVVPNYYAQRLPSELGRFDWVLDPKDVKPTPFEEVWQKVVCPFPAIDIDVRADGASRGVRLLSV
jgi:hypothetical protein